TDTLGTLCYEIRAEDLPEGVRPPASRLERLAAEDLRSDPFGPFEGRLLLRGLPPEVGDTYGARQVVTTPVADAAVPTTLVLGLANAEPLTVAQQSGIEA